WLKTLAASLARGGRLADAEELLTPDIVQRDVEALLDLIRLLIKDGRTSKAVEVASALKDAEAFCAATAEVLARAEDLDPKTAIALWKRLLARARRESGASAAKCAASAIAACSSSTSAFAQ